MKKIWRYKIYDKKHAYRCCSFRGNKNTYIRRQKNRDLDFESSTKEQLRGNIYLAKVSRVEPSLRAAFVDYGNDRHGFLPFNEIHPDYFQIPIADKQELLAGTIDKVKSEEVFSLSLNGDNNAKEVIDIFTIAFARTLSDLSLTFSSGGGIILAGSLSRSFLSIANKDLFNKHFLDGKSDIHKEILNKIDIKVINKGYTCLYGSLNYVNNI